MIFTNLNVQPILLLLSWWFRCYYLYFTAKFIKLLCLMLFAFFATINAVPGKCILFIKDYRRNHISKYHPKSHKQYFIEHLIRSQVRWRSYRTLPWAISYKIAMSSIYFIIKTTRRHCKWLWRLIKIRQGVYGMKGCAIHRFSTETTHNYPLTPVKNLMSTERVLRAKDSLRSLNGMYYPCL